MKHLGFRVFALTVLTVCSLTSCKEDIWEGGAKDMAMQMDKNDIAISVAGGTDTIRLLNYAGFSLKGVSECVNDTILYREPQWDGSTDSVFYNMTGEWYSIRIPREDYKMLIVECSENTKLDDRFLIICVNGDLYVSSRIYVYQSPWGSQLPWEYK